MPSMEIKFTARCQNCGENLKVDVDDVTPYLVITVEPCDCVEQEGYLRGKQETTRKLEEKIEDLFLKEMEGE